MTPREWYAVATVTAGLVGGLALVRWHARRCGAPPELARKAMHVAMGSGCIAFPWVFDRPLPVWLLAGLATLLLAPLRLVPSLRGGIGSPLHGIERPSYGEILFAPAVAAVFHASRGVPLMHVVPVAILTVADAAGALAGKRWGILRYQCGGTHKTVEGSLAFLAAAFLCVFLPLLQSGTEPAIDAIWISLILAILAMMAEGVSDRGFDNLVLPIGSFFVLKRLLPLTTNELAGRFVSLTVVFGLVIWGGRWSTLNGASLLAGALLGYGCAVLADWRYALPPVALFVQHVITTRKFGLTNLITHRLDVVVSHAIACLPWVLLSSTGKVREDTGLIGISFAMAAQLAILDATTRVFLGEARVNPLRSTAKGWLIAAMPGLVWFAPSPGGLALPAACGIAASALAVSLFERMRSRRHRPWTLLWILKGTASLLASSPALLYQP